ncbi:Alpha/Beta hydrolase protein [Mycena filopes]|nr:Alpha/Beta hydrolase protein [Mycena filopes]
MFLFHLLTAVVLLYSDFTVAADAPTASLPYGTFRGSTEGALTKYLGIPFATASRFETPKPPKPMSGVQNATVFAPACPQQALSPGPVSFPPPPSGFSEDCLNLDIYAPSTSHIGSKLPVLVWIFGGGFQAGDSAATDFLPLVGRSMQTNEPVIVVAPNYRVSAFGFLPGKEVGAAGVSNLGLRDVIFALEWVQNHISSFRGDPNRVVIGGLSAGAISVATLLLSNKQNSNTLFHGMFMESGAPIMSPTLADGQSVYDALVRANNCNSARNTLDCLRAVPFESFMGTVNATQDIFSFHSLSLIWRPYIDGDVVERAPLTSVAKGLYAKIPIVAGSCDDEGTLFSFSTFNITTDAEFLDYVHSNYLPSASPAQIAQIGRLYPDDPAQGSPFGTGTEDQLAPQYKRLAAFQGDLIFIGMRRFLLQHASSTQKTWSWLSKYGKDTSPLGATHTSDNSIWFTSNTTGVGAVGIDALINFVNTLDPNTPAECATSAAKLPIYWPQWKTVTPSAGGSSSLLTFGASGGTNVTADDFRGAAIAFLSGLLLEEAGRE